MFVISEHFSGFVYYLLLVTYIVNYVIVNHSLFCSYSLTLIDALDTLAIIGNYSEFRRVHDLLITSLNFDRDINVSVFETNIRGQLPRYDIYNFTGNQVIIS